MSNPLQFYIREKQLFQEQLSTVKRRLTQSSLLRLVVFCAICAAVYFFFGNTQLLVPVVVVGVVVFSLLVLRYAALTDKKKKLQALIDINTIEIEALHRNVSNLDTGKEFEDQLHKFSYDIDLFGKGSFFQYLNRTVLVSGKRLLVDLLTSNNTEGIEKKQEVVKELSEKPRWRQDFSATGSLVEPEFSAEEILTWLKSHKNFAPAIMKFMPIVFGIISLGIVVLNYLAFVPLSVTVLWFFIGLGITAIYLKKINVFYHNVNKAKDTFKQYYQLLHLIEVENFASEVLKQKQQAIKTETKKASEIFREFSKMLDAFDQRNNMLIGVVANGFALRDIQLCYKIEQWIATYVHQVENWFEVIAFYDAYNSLGNYAYNHPEHTFPQLSLSNFVIDAHDLGHPLISETSRINNNFSIENEQFFIITGANMAGKSTFLRTVSLSIIMANSGLPVCASRFTYSPIKLITSMRTSDSLSDDESYFFSELKRLKMIVEEISDKKEQSNYFIILDEILKGTNSQDKAIGSRKFVERLVASNSTGIIATHDLSLCEIEKELPEVKNHYFDAEIIDDELHFDYKFKDGICKNMNASFLLKKMDIV
tara:strand:+ start:23784 stop:25565 length:1782 start_codon:yes stop_codon:yes gene_type:complete